MTLWFYEEKNFAGRWCPRTATTKPEHKKSEGEKAKIRAVREVAPQYEPLTIAQLAELYSPDGKFQAQTQ